MQNTSFIKLLFLLSTLFISACGMGVRGEFASMADGDLSTVQEWSRLDGDGQATILGDLIQSSGLDALVDEALAANPGLQQTLLTLRIRQAEYRQVGGDRLPEIEAGYSVGKEKDGDTTYTGSLSIRWEVDLWGKLSDNTAAAGKDVAEQQALYQAAQDTLAAEVMKTWLALTAAGKNIAIERQRLDTLEKNEAFILKRYRNGLGTLEDLDSARSKTSSSRATLEEYRETLAQQGRVLRTLLGQTSGAGAEEREIPAEYAAVAVPLAEVPEQTLRRRPDLKAAYLAIEAADLRTRVAYKELLPSIDLQAALEDVASSPGSALLTDPVWSLLGQLTAPLYQGGKLRAAAEIAELETARNYQVYRETLLDAVQEIEDAIGLERSLTRQREHIEAALSAARNNLEQYQRKYRTGLVEILDLLEVQQQTYDLDIQLNNLTYERLANRIDLGLALGLGVKS